MSNRLIPFLFFVLFLSLAATLLYHLVRGPKAWPGPSRTTLAAASEIPGATKGTPIPADVDTVLRVALLVAAPHGDASAVADVADVSIRSGVMHWVPLGLCRALLPEFRGVTISGGVRLAVFAPATDGCLLWFERESLLQNVPAGTWPSGTVPLRCVTYPERWILRRGDPLVCLAERSPAALAFVVLDREEAAATDGGTLAYWRDLFRGTGKSPLLSRADAEEVLRAAMPSRGGRPFPAELGVTAAAPLSGALGCYLLGDLEGLAMLRRSAAVRPGLLAGALAARQRERLDEEWTTTDALFALRLLGLAPGDYTQLEEVVSEHLGRGVNYEGVLFRLFHVDSPFRTGRMIDDPGADDAAASRLRSMLTHSGSTTVDYVPYEYDLSGDPGRYAFEHNPPNDRELVRDTWKEARESWLSRLPEAFRPWVVKEDRAVAIFIAMVVASLLVSVLPRGRRPRVRVPRMWLFFLYALTALRWGPFHFSYVFAPAWVIIVLAWLRSDVPHPWWERAAIFVTLLSSAVLLGFREGAAILHPALDALGGAWFGFAWLILGRIVLTTPEHRESRSFRTFITLHTFLTVQLTAALLSGQMDKAGPAVLTTFGVAGAALLWFCLEGAIGRLRSRLAGRGG